MQRDVLSFGRKQYVCESAGRDVCVPEEGDGARVIGRRVMCVSRGAERWQLRSQGNVAPVARNDVGVWGCTMMLVPVSVNLFCFSGCIVFVRIIELCVC